MVKPDFILYNDENVYIHVFKMASPDTEPAICTATSVIQLKKKSLLSVD